MIDTVDVDFCNNDTLCNADVARMLIYVYVCCVNNSSNNNNNKILREETRQARRKREGRKRRACFFNKSYLYTNVNPTEHAPR